MSFTLDGHTIETDPITMALLDCGDSTVMPGHETKAGDWDACTDQGHDHYSHPRQIVRVFHTEMVPVTYVN